MASRIAHNIDFPDYTPGELLQISDMMLQQQHYKLSPEARVAMEEYIEKRLKQPNFANARSIRNAIDRARLRHANRIFGAATEGQELTADDFSEISESDLRASRVFQNTSGDE